MALDRTWYNSLVDDDGSGLTGSVWDKADVNALMNAIDAQLASALVSGYEWVSYSPHLHSAAGPIWSATSAYGRYLLGGANGKTVTVQYSLEGVNITAPIAELWIGLPFAASAWPGTQVAMVPLFIAGAYESAHISVANADPSYMHLARMANQTFPVAGSIYIRGTFIYRTN